MRIRTLAWIEAPVLNSANKRAGSCLDAKALRFGSAGRREPRLMMNGLRPVVACSAIAAHAGWSGGGTWPVFTQSGSAISGVASGVVVRCNSESNTSNKNSSNNSHRSYHSNSSNLVVKCLNLNNNSCCWVCCSTQC